MKKLTEEEIRVARTKETIDEEVAAGLARAETRRCRNGQVCLSCQQPWKDRIRGMVKVKAREAPGLSYEKIREILQAKWGYPRSDAALRAHILNHEPELFAEMKGVRDV